MQSKKILLLIGLLFLLSVIGITTAQDIQVSSTLYPSDALIANGQDSISIRLVVYNLTSVLTGNTVEFSFDNPEVGNLQYLTLNTDVNGQVVNEFTSTTVPGKGNLYIKVYYDDEGSPKVKNLDPVPIRSLAYPDLILNSTEKNWVVANGIDQTRIQFFTYNTTYNCVVPNLDVEFSVNDSIFGTISPISNITNINGNASSVFKTATKSGTVRIDAKIYDKRTNLIEPRYVSIEQKIDHDFPYQFDTPAFPDYESEVMVGSMTNITVKMLDKWGNIVENRRESDEGRIAEEVKFSVEGSPSAGINYGYMAKFWNGTEFIPFITVPVNDSGILDVALKVDDKPGINYILISPQVATIADKYIQITGIATGIPAHIYGYVNPAAENGNNPWVYTGTDPSDDSRKFTITYYVLDEFGNGLQLKAINITIFADNQKENLEIVTNSTGYASFKYGPRSLAIRDVVVNAVPEENPNISANPILLDFISADPIDMVITANPQNLASRDAKPTSSAQIRAKIINAVGDGVANETVTFSIQNIHNLGGETYTIVQDPSLDENYNITDEDGYATITFRPGEFTTSFSDPHYDSTATSACDVVAIWTSPTGIPVTRKVEITWKNYPYLNVFTYLDQESVNVTDTINLTIRLVGDGYKMEKKPIDVIICHDRSGSMLQELPDRMVSAMAAATAFVSNTESGKDRTGLVSFGNSGTANIFDLSYRYWAGIDTQTVCEWTCDEECYWDWWRWRYVCEDVCGEECNTQNWYDDDASYIASHYPANGKTYSSYATVDTNPGLDFNKDNVTTAISRLVPYGGTPMRYGLYKSILEFNNYPPRDAVKAIIVISDGDYNYYGDPLARGTGYTTAQKGVTTFNDRTPDYTILSGIAYQNLSRVALENNIRIYTIAYSSSISSWTNETLRIMSESTGGRHYVAPTGTDLETIYTLIAGQLREEAGVDIEMYADFGTIEVNAETLAGSDVFDYIALNPTSTKTSKYSSKTLTTEYGWINHTDDWLYGNQQLPFTIGTMYLNDIWEANMMFKVKTSGNIKLFNNTVPAIFFSTPEGPQQLTLPDTYLYASVEEVTGPDYGNFTESDFEVINIENTIFEWSWQRVYTGNLPLKEQYFVSVDGGKSWTQVGERILTPEEATTETTGRFRYDIRNLVPPGMTAIVDFRLTGRAIDAPSPRKIQEVATFDQTGIYILLE